MNGNAIKYVFWILTAILLILMLLLSIDAGINCDEVLHYNHSQDVYRYFASAGADHAALHTPVTHLQYYGQSYDNIVTILINWLNIEDVYRFRHIMSLLAGWGTILITALFAVWLSGYGTGIIVLILFAVSPTFIGHSQNNLKDIPFALSYILGIFMALKYLFSGPKLRLSVVIFLVLSIAFAISIRAGGIILICYVFFFFFLYQIYIFYKNRSFDKDEILKKFLIIIVSAGAAWILGILLWPYALQSPVKNVIESYRVMASYPDTFRQIFEGKNEWSDFMPWYYLPKSMAITIPLIVLAGVLLFLVSLKKIIKDSKGFHFAVIIFTVIFPVLFVIYKKSNVYSSWRQFLFLYPGIVLISATGYNYFFRFLKSTYLKYLVWVVLAFLAIHPVSYMLKNRSLIYIYYNQFVGGLKGAYSNYETDYYYVGQTEASDWLIDYLGKNLPGKNVKVKATYSVTWQFRKHPEIETSYFRFEERSMADWDYAIITNRYIPLFQLRNNMWPPKNAIHTIYADGVPVCTILKRETKDDYKGYLSLNEGHEEEAVNFFDKVLHEDIKDEMIFYNFAAALIGSGDQVRADSVLKAGLEINPDFDLILMYLGNIAVNQNRKDDAVNYYERVIGANRKYFEAYVELSKLIASSDRGRARDLLRECLNIDPEFTPAIVALADTYRESDPDIAKKYDEMAEKINNQ